MRFSLFLTAFLLLPAGLGAYENEGLFLKIYLPRIGVIDLEGVSISIIPSPFIRVPDRPGEAQVIPDDDDKIPKEYTKSSWEEMIRRRWIRLEFKNRPTVKITIPDISITRPGHSFSLFVSLPQEQAVSFGRFIGPDLIDVLFTYFTINAVFGESEKIERARPHLKELTASKKGIKLRGRLVRVETNALHLFNQETGVIDFLDFYLADIEFDEN